MKKKTLRSNTSNSRKLVMPVGGGVDFDNIHELTDIDYNRDNILEEEAESINSKRTGHGHHHHKHGHHSGSKKNSARRQKEEKKEPQLREGGWNLP